MKASTAAFSIALAVGSLSFAVPAREARADKPYITFHDEDGAFAAKTTSPAVLVKRTLDHYNATGLPIPDVMSVWTTFPMLGNDVATYIDPLGNDVSGINIGMQTPAHPPLRAMLFHNNVTALPKRAALQRAPLDGFSSYLFLLEFMHNWGPEINVPAPNQQDLIGFDYHWSFFLEGTSPAGGNQWHDNGDGTYTVVPRLPKDVTYTPIDLYLMGLATKDEVPPFGVLVSTVVPASPTDPLWGGAFAGHSFPWFDSTNPPLIVQATRRVVTIDDVIAANGPRVPAAGTKTSFTLGIALVVGKDETDAQVAADEATFDPVAADLAPAFFRATGQRGTLDVVTHASEGTGGAGGAGTGGAGGTTSATSATSTGAGGKAPETSSGCAVGAGESSGEAAFVLAFALTTLASRRRRR